MSEFTEQVRSDLREAAESDLPAFQRLERLRAIRRDLDDMVDEADAAIHEAELAAGADDAGIGLAVIALRERATLGDTLVADGATTAEALAESGLLTHADLDALEEENLLEATALLLVEAPAFVGFDAAGEALLASE